MLTADNVLHVSGILLIILISASFLTYTGKFIFRADKLKRPTHLIYDPDHGANISAVCIFSKEPYSTAYEKSPCHNKTLVQWYNPWLRHGFWTGLRNDIKARNRGKEVELSQTKIENRTKLPPDADDPPVNLSPKKENSKNQKPKENGVEFVYSLLVGLLIASMLFACWEVFKERLKKNGVATAKSQGQECTLADFTINRHRRRESQQQQQQSAAHIPRQGPCESTAKVTQTLIHQSSLDRAFPQTISEAVKSMEGRRYSMPICVDSEVQVSGKSPSTGTKIKRQSVDVSVEDSNFDSRKKFRHLIRRH